PRRRTGASPATPARSGNWPSRVRPLSSRRFRGQLLALLDRLFDGADHVEGRLRQVVVLAFHQALEAADGVGEIDELAGRTGEHFGDEEWLRQEALDLARTRDRELVLLRQLVHAQDRDN